MMPFYFCRVFSPSLSNAVSLPDFCCCCCCCCYLLCYGRAADKNITFKLLELWLSKFFNSVTLKKKKKKLRFFSCHDTAVVIFFGGKAYPVSQKELFITQIRKSCLFTDHIKRGWNETIWQTESIPCNYSTWPLFPIIIYPPLPYPTVKANQWESKKEREREKNRLCQLKGTGRRCPRLRTPLLT